MGANLEWVNGSRIKAVSLARKALEAVPKLKRKKRDIELTLGRMLILTGDPQAGLEVTGECGDDPWCVINLIAHAYCTAETPKQEWFDVLNRSEFRRYQREVMRYLWDDIKAECSPNAADPEIHFE